MKVTRSQFRGNEDGNLKFKQLSRQAASTSGEGRASAALAERPAARPPQRSRRAVFEADFRNRGWSEGAFQRDGIPKEKANEFP
jgi:hypothetical protein